MSHSMIYMSVSKQKISFFVVTVVHAVFSVAWISIFKRVQLNVCSGLVGIHKPDDLTRAFVAGGFDWSKIACSANSSVEFR